MFILTLIHVTSMVFIMCNWWNFGQIRCSKFLVIKKIKVFVREVST